MRMLKYLQGVASLQRAAGNFKCDPFRLTPGQFAELSAELGREPDSVTTCQGVHTIEKIHCHIRATGDNVIMCPREDLFQESDREVGVELVSTANAVTSVPDNIGCVEIVSVGEQVSTVKPGEIVFIDFYRVKQGYILDNEELYIAGSDAFAAKYDAVTQNILPLDNHVVTRSAVQRFAVALNGTDRILAPETVTTDGFVSGKTSRGSAAARTVYQEIVAIGKLTGRPRPGCMTKAERKVLDAVLERSFCEPSEHPLSETFYEEALSIFDAFRREHTDGRVPDIEVGQLVGFCKEIGTRVRVRGEYRWLVPYESVLAEIDDAGLLDDAIRAGNAGVILRAAG